MRKKIYAITFLKYTDYAKTAVSDNNGHYVHIPSTGYLLIFENEIPYYQQYGGGLKDIIFIGYLDLKDDEFYEKTLKEYIRGMYE